MELDHRLMFNFLSIFGTILFIFAASTTIFVKLRRRWPVSVNCWFCNSNAKVQRQQLHWWFCTSCEQYNGFTKDGDYSYDIPERYGSPMRNGTQYCEKLMGRSDSNSPSNSLCYDCNRNEEFKLSELRRFEAINDKGHDIRVQLVKKNLEDKYPLCQKCKTSVQNVLQTQARWLIQYKMLFFRQKAVQSILTHKKPSEDIFRKLSTVLVVILAYNNRWSLLPVCGLLLQMCVCWMNSLRKKMYDAVLACLWCCTIIIVISPGKLLPLLGMKNSIFSFEDVTQPNMLLPIAFTIALMNTLHKSYGRKSVKSICLKRIKHFSASPIRETSLCTDLNIIHDVEDDNALNAVHVTNRNSKTRNLRSPTSVCPEVTLSKPVESQFASSARNSNEQRSVNYSTKVRASASLLNDSVTTLSALSLNETQLKYSSKSPKMFEKKIYGTGSGSDLFKKQSVSGRKYILSPPRLKSVLQASWVAGGYWQEGMDTPSLSRSSSQSSGFGSGGSNFAPSRETSVHECDRYSVVSDAAQSCYGPKSIVSSHKMSSTLCYPLMRNCVQDHRTFVQQQHITAPTQCQMGISMINNGLHAPQHQRMTSINKSTEIPVCSNHTTTIVTTSPIWLSTLLCCSVVLNAIVLCTTFLR